MLGGKKARDDGPPGGAGARATSGFRSERKKPAHLLSVQASRRISCLDVQISGRRPPGTELTSDGVPATLEDKTSLASRAHGTQSSRPPRPQPPCHRRRPGQHVRAGRPQQNLASTFGPAQYNPAAARRGRGLGAHGQGVGEQGGRRSPGRSPGRGHAAARPQSLSGRRLFVLGLAGPALLVSPIGSERAAGVCACAAAPPVPPRRICLGFSGTGVGQESRKGGPFYPRDSPDLRQLGVNTPRKGGLGPGRVHF